MVNLLLVLVVGFLIFVPFSLVRLIVTADTTPSKEYKEPTKREIEKQQLKAKMKLRNLRVEVMKWYIDNPKYKENYKFLVRKELEVAQMLKGLKRRTISDIKYEAISKAAKSGKFDKEVLDMINQ